MIIDDISAHLKDAMRAREKVRITALRNVRAALIEAMKVDGSDTIADDAALGILRRLAKQRRESIDAFQKGGRDDLVAQEQGELAVIEAFLPQLADEATTRTWAAEAIAAAGATQPGDMGKVMGRLMAAHRDTLDGKLASRIVRELLAQA